MGVNSMSECVGKVKYSVVVYNYLNVGDIVFYMGVRLYDSRETGRWDRFFGSSVFVATKHGGTHRGLNRLNPLTLNIVLCL